MPPLISHPSRERSALIAIAAHAKSEFHSRLIDIRYTFSGVAGRSLTAEFQATDENHRLLYPHLCATAT
jgi:hypothetical protein